MKFVLSLLLFLFGCNVYELVGKESSVSSEFEKLVNNPVSEYANLQTQNAIVFPDTLIGLSDVLVLPIFNNGYMDASSFVVTSSSADFSVSNNTCGSEVLSLVTCSVDIFFSPSIVDSFSGTLDISYEDGNSTTITKSINLYGTGIGTAALTISESDPYFFGAQAIGTSTPKQFIISNTGNLDVIITPPTLAAPFGYTGGAYPGTAGDCASMITIGASCNIEIEFLPTAAQTYTELFLIDYQDLNSNMYQSSKNLSGEGV